MDISLSVLIAQLINFALLYGAFKYFLGDKYSAMIESRRSLDTKYNALQGDIDTLLHDAKLQKDAMLQEAVEHKKRLVDEASIVASNKAHSIVEKAQSEADILVENARAQNDQVRKQLEKEFVRGVKDTSRSVVTKLIGSDKALNDAYLDTVVAEYSAPAQTQLSSSPVS